MLSKITQPEDLREIAQEWLGILKPEVPISDLDAFPHKVYHVRPDDISGEKEFSDPQHVSWRYLLTDPTLASDDPKQSFGLEIRRFELRNERVKYNFQEIQYGTIIESMRVLLTSLKDFSELNGEEEYESSYLRMIPILMNAIWFRATERENDYFLPLPPYFFGLEQNKLYTTAEFLEIARKATPPFEDNPEITVS